MISKECDDPEFVIQEKEDWCSLSEKVKEYILVKILYLKSRLNPIM